MKSTHEYEDPDLGVIKVRKVASTRRLRIRPYADHVLVTIPRWAAFQAGKDFALTQTNWIKAHRPPSADIFMTGDRVGKQHSIEFKPSVDIPKARSRITGSLIRIEYPTQLSANHTQVQAEAKKAVTRALRKEAEQYLPHRLAQLAQTHGFVYKTVTIKQLKTRWGSCSNTKAINLNLQLMRLPDRLIDYVLLHELTHTKHLNHSPEFWQAVGSIAPDYKQLRKELKTLSATGF